MQYAPIVPMEYLCKVTSEHEAFLLLAQVRFSTTTHKQLGDLPNDGKKHADGCQSLIEGRRHDRRGGGTANVCLTAHRNEKEGRLGGEGYPKQDGAVAKDPYKCDS